ncbi:hypothetical protein IFM89_030901 [Coptis chinensis]|uniref:Uncharacterized protein n=1 Tax=Coptis chinensis TaxID=261450 RepID=A0A835I4Z7_9MAGN|nr:hypothetical protein IFM89_030901 [Coptis chinensis]
MRLGNRQCPTCRKSLPSRRFLREDHLCNRLVAALYPNMNSSWQEDVELTDEEKAQTEQGPLAPGKNHREVVGEDGEKNQNNGIQISDNDEEAQWTDGGRDSSSADPPYSPTNSAMELDINEQVAVTAEGTGPANNEFVSLSGVGSWGKGRQRSQTLRGTGRGSKNGRKGNHVNRLANHLDQLRIDRNNQELDICVALIALNEQTLPSLEQPYVSCQPTFSVKQLCQYVAEETRVPPREVDILLVSEPSFATSGSLPSYDPSKGELQSLHPQETVEGLQTSCTNTEGVLVLGYMRKPSN